MLDSKSELNFDCPIFDHYPFEGVLQLEELVNCGQQTNDLNNLLDNPSLRLDRLSYELDEIVPLLSRESLVCWWLKPLFGDDQDDDDYE